MTRRISILALAAAAALGQTAYGQNYNGVLETANCGAISGWGWDSTRGSNWSPLYIDLYDSNRVNGPLTLISSQWASAYRSDLQAQGVGDGNHAFSTATPASLKDGATHYITAIFHDSYTAQTLTGGPLTLSCPTGATGYSYYVQDGAVTSAAKLYANPSGVTNPNYYEANMTLALPASGGTYVTYLHASSSARTGPSPQGSFYSVEVQNPQFSGSPIGSATLVVNRANNGSITTLAATTISVHSGSVIRSVIIPAQRIIVFVDGFGTLDAGDGSGNWVSSGQPGVGLFSAPGGNSISAVNIGQYDSNPPNALTVAATNITSAKDNIQVRWVPPANASNGPGIWRYDVARYDYQGSYSGQWHYLTAYTQNGFSDYGVTAGGQYLYQICTTDAHYQSACSPPLTASALAVNSVQPGEVGIRPNGSYWGAAGEQINMKSGNLNYSQPLLKAQGRGGWGVTFNLSYNSQVWRRDVLGIEWNDGADVGYGFGWRLMAGSLTPVYQDYWTVKYYLFTDATGAVYRLNQNNGNVWSSVESIYVWYDANAGKLYFRDGSFWVLGSVSAGTEPDAGTMYPTVMQDTNGNQILVRYDAGAGASWNNSSARILEIEDVRAPQSGGYTYRFTYQGSGPKQLVSIQNSVQTGESYSFTLGSQALTGPWSGTNTGGASVLQTVTNTNTSLATQFSYNGSGELTQMTTPYGGHLRWAYQSVTLTGGSVREVQYRYVSTQSGASENTHLLARDGGDGSRAIHANGQLYDYGSNAAKIWFFQADTSQTNAGLVTTYQERRWSDQLTLNQADYGWSTNSSGNLYTSSLTTTLDPSGANAQKKTTQTIDGYGNVTQSQVYDFGNLSSPARTYNNYYLSGSQYSSRYIFNRLTGSSVTGNGQTVTLVSNSYDSGTLAYVAGMRQHDPNYTFQFTYRGNVTSSTTPAGTTSRYLDMGGNVASQTVNGVTTNQTLSSSTNYAAPSAITTGSLSNTMNWNGALNLTSASGPNGDSATFSYDPTSRPTSTVSPYGATSQYAYADGTNPPYKQATTNGHWTRTSMDGFGRTILAEAGDGGGTKSQVDSVYQPCGCSPLGKLTQTSQAHAVGGSKYWTVYTYDATGRTTQVTLPDGQSHTTYAYSGNTVTVTDPAGNAKTFTMDAFGNIKQVLEPGGLYTYYTYDALNHLTGVSMPRNGYTQTRTFNYTGAYLTSATNPETGTVSYSYNSDGTLASKTDAKNQTLSYTYDSLKRLTQVSSGGSVLRTFYYDSNPLDNSGFSQYTQGRLAAIQYGGGNMPGTFTEMYSYVPAGGATKKRVQITQTANGQTIMPLNLDATYSYDSEGHMASVSYPNGGPSYGYSFDSMGRASALADSSGSQVVSGLQYGPANELRQISYFGVTETRTYNSMLQMTALSIPGQYSATYNYSSTQNNGKITSQVDNGETVSYTYDSLNRLIAASSSAGWGQGFSYDGFGNLTNKTVTAGSAPTLSVSVDVSTNRIVGQSYDANGNQLSSPTGSLAYDAENRMISAASGSVLYAYDALNKRIWSQSGGSQTVYFFGIDGKKLGSYALVVQSPTNQTPYLTTTTIETNVYFGRKLVGRNGGAIPQDRLGSNRSGGTSYYPHGENKSGGLGDQVQFATYTRDSVTGLDYADQRYYANALGRFTSPDPYKASRGPSSPLSWNRYQYVSGDPVNYRDSSGLLKEIPGYCPAEYESCDGLIEDCSSEGEGCVSEPPTLTPIPDQDEPPARQPCEINGSIINSFISNTSIYGDKMLTKPLAGKGQSFIDTAIKFNLNPSVLVAISFWESHWGYDQRNTGTHNAFGLKARGRVLTYPTWELGIDAAGMTVNAFIRRGVNTVALLYSGARGAYCTDSGCPGAISTISDIVRKLGEDPNILTFDCEIFDGALVKKQ